MACWGAGLLPGCGTAPSVRRDYAFEFSALNVTPEAEEPLSAAAPGGPQSQPRERADLPRRPWRRVAERPVPAESAQAQSPRPEPMRSEPRAVAAPAEDPPPAVRPPPPEPALSQPPAAPATERAPQNDEDLRAAQRVEAAQALLGTPGLQERAFVAQVLKAAGQDVAVDPKQPYAAALWTRLATEQGAKVAQAEIRPGDLVFFHDTADLNGNGKPDDGVTLVGVAERVRGLHVIFIAQRAGKVRRMAVDPSRPLVIRDATNEVVNTRLVRWPGSDQAWTTGQCLTGFARPR